MASFTFINENEPGARQKVKVYTIARNSARRKVVKDAVVRHSQIQDLSLSSSGSTTPVNSVPFVGDDSALDEYDFSQDIDLHVFDLETSRISLGAFGDRISRLSHADQYLLRWYLSDLPSLAYRVPMDSPLNPFRAWTYPCGSEGELSLYGNMFHASTVYYGSIAPSLYYRARSLPAPTPDSQDTSMMVLYHRARLVGLINTALNDPEKPFSDDLMYAIYVVIHVENRLGELEAYRTHLAGLSQLIRLRGGLENLSHNRPLCGAIAFIEFSLIKYPPSVDGSPRTENVGDFGDDTEKGQEYEAFMEYLVMLQKQTNAVRNILEAINMPMTLRKYLGLAQYEALFKLLAPATTPDKNNNNSTPSVLPSPTAQIKQNFQLACLLYIHYNLTECSTLERRSVFLEQVAHSALLVEFHANSAMLLVNIFLRDMRKEEIKNVWRVVRAMRVIHRLSPNLCNVLHQVMLQQLKLETVEDCHKQMRDLRELCSMVEFECS